MNDVARTSMASAHPALIALHWLMAVLVVCALFSVALRDQLPSGHALRPLLRSIHMLLGACVFVLLPLRLWVRSRYPLPRADRVPAWSTWGGHASHLLLYLAMAAQPVTGTLFMQADGRPVKLLGTALPTLIEPDKQLHLILKDAHLSLGNALYVLVALHVTAALWHHFVLRNATLSRLLPWRRRPTSAPAPVDVVAVEPVSAATSRPSPTPAAKTSKLRIDTKEFHD